MHSAGEGSSITCIGGHKKYPHFLEFTDTEKGGRFERLELEVLHLSFPYPSDCIHNSSLLLFPFSSMVLLDSMGVPGEPRMESLKR